MLPVFVVGQRVVSIAVPEAVAVVQRAEGPYPSRLAAERYNDLEWIYKHNDLPYPMLSS